MADALRIAENNINILTFIKGKKGKSSPELGTLARNTLYEKVTRETLLVFSVLRVWCTSDNKQGYQKLM